MKDTSADNQGNRWDNTLVPSHVQKSINGVPVRNPDGTIRKGKIVYSGRSSHGRYTLEAALAPDGTYDIEARTNGLSTLKGVGHSLESLKNTLQWLAPDLGVRRSESWEKLLR